MPSFKKKKYDKRVALEKAKYYCAYQERCHSEVKNKLFEWGLYASEVDEIIADLISENFLNEQRFAESYVTGKFRIKSWGKVKIEQHLKTKHISGPCIRQAMLSIEDDEYEKRCMALAQKKASLMNSSVNQWDRNAKISRYLVSKGYEYSIIHKILPEI